MWQVFSKPNIPNSIRLSSTLVGEYSWHWQALRKLKKTSNRFNIVWIRYKED